MVTPIIDNIDNKTDNYVEPSPIISYEMYDKKRSGLGYVINKEDDEFVYIHQFKPDKYFKLRRENK
jgi:hypothetical protein